MKQLGGPQYGNNRVKYQEEVQKLYQKENVSPMGGCAPGPCSPCPF